MRKFTLIFMIIVITAIFSWVLLGNHFTDQDWNTYKDEKYLFKIDYPSDQEIIILDPEEVDAKDQLYANGGVSFAKLGPGLMGVKVYEDIESTSIEEWFSMRGSQFLNLKKEEVISIDGYDAIVTHKATEQEEFLHEKRVYFLKDGDLYEIWTNFYENPELHKIVWESMQF